MHSLGKSMAVLEVHTKLTTTPWPPTAVSIGARSNQQVTPPRTSRASAAGWQDRVVGLHARPRASAAGADGTIRLRGPKDERRRTRQQVLRWQTAFALSARTGLRKHASQATILATCRAWTEELCDARPGPELPGPDGLDIVTLDGSRSAASWSGRVGAGRRTSRRSAARAPACTATSVYTISGSLAMDGRRKGHHRARRRLRAPSGHDAG